MSLSRKFSLAVLVVALGSGVTACDKRDESSADGTDSSSPGATTEPGASSGSPDTGAPGTGGPMGTEPPPASGSEGGTGTAPGSTTPPPADSPASGTGTGGSDNTR